MTLLRALNTTIGKKLVMAVTGLLLVGFLVVHLAGNFLMYVGPGAYNGYAHALHSQEWFVKTAETGLAILFFAHLYLAIRTTIDNRKARRNAYVEKETKQVGGVPSQPSMWMFWSGVVLLGFIMLHLTDFALEARESLPQPLGVTDVYTTSDGEHREPFDKAVLLLKNPLSASVYLIGCAMLTFHLVHGIGSSFQTLGVSHTGWRKCLAALGIVLAVVFGLGFASFVLWAQFQPMPG